MCLNGASALPGGISMMTASMWTLPEKFRYIPRPPISGQSFTSCVEASWMEYPSTRGTPELFSQSP
jgi:hypothetical protein